MVECEDKIVGRMYAKVTYHYFTAILEASPNVEWRRASSNIMIQVPYGHNRRDTLRQQGELIQTLSKLSQQIRAMKEPRAKKVKGEKSSRE